ncbi:pyridoxamine 5'-phosphate oxidase family protein [Marinomonas sp. RSW2]|uniref:Pyridoxamine 5'-phosphate oxidase family protein n=1 Tax=Marinomonas maritima TaxID=2940935 RepID=A0ABT5WCD8_9GAMM|nr:pyridoxamine 5'-phosphate oxidase family protein [Marinomonas maritima]MDE8602465.1 pyridoxamine 5'-phosphate oxidase family protein [Marinomonas maritima]
MKFIDNIGELEDMYGLPSDAALKKVINIITPSYKTWIEKSSFCVISSVGLEGTDASPRGDEGQVVKILNDKTIALPDWQGNQRIDTIRNIVQDGRVSLLFMISGSNNVIRINGQAKITIDSELKKHFIHKDRHPKTVIVIEVREVYFQCARALMRSELWQSGDQASGLPTPGSILKEITNGVFDGDTYDSSWPDRCQKSLW